MKEPIKIRQATTQGYIECPAGGGFDAAYPNSKLRRGRVQQNGDVVGALTASADNHCVYEGMQVIGSTQANAMRGSIDGVSPCLTEAMGMGGGQIPMVTTRYRIRKLTERECFRLMDMDDADIDKIDAYRIKTTLKDGRVKEKPIPKSQKYKMAGNSICVGVLYHIFHQIFIADPPKPKPIQKSLFD